MKKTIILTLILICACNLFAQSSSKQQTDCPKRIKKISTLFQKKLYDEAYYSEWQFIFKNCPCSDKYFYSLYTRTLFDRLIEKENNPDRRERLIDTLLDSYDKRIMCFPTDFSEEECIRDKANYIYKYRGKNMTNVGEMVSLLNMYIQYLDMTESKKRISSYVWENYIELAARISNITQKNRYVMEAYKRAADYDYRAMSSFDSFLKNLQAEEKKQIKPCPKATVVKDLDGNVYNTIQIGNQCWMRENLRVTQDKNGVPIEIGRITNSTKPLIYYPDMDQKNVSQYGYLYNWDAAIRACPSGWHLPEYSEWMELIDYVGNQDQNICGEKRENINKSLASNSYWKDMRNREYDCTTYSLMFSNNATGFTALPAGIFYDRDNSWFQEAFVSWGSTMENNNFYFFAIFSDKATWEQGYIDKRHGCSVRCVKDNKKTSK